MDITVCFASDAGYARHLAVALASLLHNKARGDRLTICILDGGIAERDRRILEGMAQEGGASLRFVPVRGESFHDAPIQTLAGSVSHISRAAYYRLLLASLLPDVEKVIYLDCDLVCRGSLAPLYGLDMKGDWLRGVVDIDAETHRRRLGLRKYICSGVLLVDLKAWREHSVEERCTAFLRDHADMIVLHDQDVLNVVCQEHLGYLDRIWNAQACATRQGRLSGFNDVAKIANIVHFIGGRKPWQAGCQHPFRREYFRYLRMTPYRNMVWRWRWDCLIYALAHTKYSHGRKRWYVCGIRVWQKRD
ncbi:MAG: glycosyltransferase family 8 protein [Mailhella sp.]|nr:glycosyltransferase family 8 protein [Mailhella sp.]